MDTAFYDSLAKTFGLEKTKSIAASAALWLQIQNGVSPSVTDTISVDSLSRTDTVVNQHYRVVDAEKEYAIIGEIDDDSLKSPTPSVSWGKRSKHHPTNPYVRIVIDSIRNHVSMTKNEICEDTSIVKRKVAEILRELKKQGIVIEC